MTDKLTTAPVREAVVMWPGLQGFDEWLKSVQEEAYDEGYAECARTDDGGK